VLPEKRVQQHCHPLINRIFLLQFYAKKMRNFWGRKSVCLVTGASQNIGRAFAESVASKLAPDSLLILTSRSSDKLGMVRQEAYTINPSLRIQLLEWDLAHPDGERYKQELADILRDNESEAQDFDLAMIVHNARTSGDAAKHVDDLHDAAYIQEHLNINLVSMLVANSAFWSVFGQAREKVLINMTAVPETATGLTAISKASRTIALNTLSHECPDIRVLHYSPGAVDASALLAVRRSSIDPGVDRKTQELFEQNKVLKPKQTVQALVDFLGSNEIEPCMELDAQQLLKK